MIHGGLGKQSRDLEAEFFAQKDRVLIEKLKQMKQMEETKQALSEVSGITNDRVLQKLVDLHIHVETVAALAAVPLIEVAWADGSIDDKEREAVLLAADRSGIKKGNVEYTLIERWLNHKPGAHLLEAWVHYIEGLCEQLSAEEKDSLKKELLENTRMVAEASGGILGMGKISRAETEMLRNLESAFS